MYIDLWEAKWLISQLSRDILASVELNLINGSEKIDKRNKLLFTLGISALLVVVPDIFEDTPAEFLI